MGFLFSEAELSITFARLAQAAKNEEKRKREQANARLGYDRIQYFLSKPKPPMDQAEKEKLSPLISELKERLTELGERFEE